MPWPKLFQNLRSTRQTELEEDFPSHVVCAWIGNSEEVARKHYLQVTDEHFSKAVQKAVHALPRTPEPVRFSATRNDEKHGVSRRKVAEGGLELSPDCPGQIGTSDRRAAQLEAIEDLFERLTDEERAEFFRQQFLAAAREPSETRKQTRRTD